MNERKVRQQLLRKYLIKMDLGDSKAENMVSKIAKTMSDKEDNIAKGRRSKPVYVIHTDGSKEWFSSRKEVAAKYGISKNTIATCINKKTVNQATGLRFENAKRKE